MSKDDSLGQWGFQSLGSNSGAFSGQGPGTEVFRMDRGPLLEAYVDMLSWPWYKQQAGCKRSMVFPHGHCSVNRVWGVDGILALLGFPNVNRTGTCCGLLEVWTMQVIAGLL